MNTKNDIIIFKDDSLEIEVNISPNENTVLLTQDQISTLFDKNKSTISRHIKNIFESGELDKIDSVAKNATELNITDYRTGKKQNAQREIEYYNLDVIISVGYRVNSIRGTVFRKWANKILKEYMYKGFVIDQQKLISNDTNYRSFASTVKLISDLVDRKQLMIGESTGLLKIISKYAYALDTLDKYDHQTLTITNITKDDKQIKLEYDDATFKLFPSKVTKGFFGSQRFDRVDGKKQHVISLAAILETTHRISNLDYKHLFQVIQKISVDKEDYYEAFRRMTFNVLYGNKDDHGKKPGFYI